MARAAASAVLRIIIEGDASGASRSIRQVGVDLADAARAWAAYEGVSFLKGATEAASSLLESQNKVDQVFGASADAVRQFGAQAAQSLGQSEQAVNQATGTYGNLLQAFGLSQEQAAEMSVTLVRLASDLAAFNDVPVEEVITSLRAAIAGEIEPARRLGINLLDVRLKSEAMAMGLYDGVGALDASAKALAAYTAIIEDTSIAQGQFERESEGLLAQQMKASAEWENAKASLGQEFIPAFTLATKAVSGLSQAFAALPGPLKVALVGGTGLAVLGPRLVTAFGAATEAVLNFRLGLMGVRTPGAGAANAIGAVLARAAASPPIMAGAAVGVGALTIAYLELSDGAKRAKENAEALVEAAEATGDSIEQVFNERLANTIAGIDGGFDIGESASGFRDALRDLGIGADELAAALRGSDAEFDALKAQIQEGLIRSGRESLVGPILDDLDTLRSSGQRATSQQRDLSRAQRELGISTEYTTDGLTENTGATEANTRAQRTQADAIEEATKRFEEKVDAANRTRNAQEGLTDAQSGLTSATEELAEAERAAAGDSDEMRSALQAEEDAVRGVADAREAQQEAIEAVRDAEERVVDAQRNVLDAQRNLNDARETATERIEDMARAAREAVLSEAEADLALRKAREELEDFDRGGSRGDALAREELVLKIQRLEEELRQAGEDRVTTAQDAAEAAAAGVEGSREFQDAQRQLADAHDAVAEAQDGVRDAHERVTDAADGVRDAEDRVADAQRNTARVGRDAADRLEQAKKDVYEANLTLIDAETDLATAVYGVEAGVKLQIDRLREFANMWAPGTPERTNLEWLITLLQGTLTGEIRDPAFWQNLRDGAYVGPRPGDAGSGGGSPDSADRRGRRGTSIVYAPTIYGTAANERRIMEQQGQEFLNDAAAAFGG